MQAVQQQNILRDILAGATLTILLLIFGIVTTWLIPLPVLYYRIKLGRNTGLLIPAAVTLIVFLFGKEFSSGLAWVLLGFVLGECFDVRISIEKTVLFSSLIVLSAGGLALFFYSNISHTGIYELAYTQIKISMGYLVKAGLIADVSEDVLHRVTCMLPGLIATTVMLIAWINTVLGQTLLKRKQIDCPDFGILDMWKAPEHLVWVAIVATAGFLSHSATVSIICSNAMWLVFLIYFFQGISIVSFFIKKTKIPVMLRYLLYWLIFFQFPVNLLIAVIGLFDMWVNFRKLGTKLTGDTGD